MGRAKAWMMEQWDRGYSEADGNICADCVNDPVLKRWVADNAAADACTFCGSESAEPMAASFDEFVGKVLTGVRFDWNHPDDEGISYISAEGGYQASISDTWDVLGDYDISDDSDVIDAIAEALGNNGWVERGFYAGDKSQRLEWGWDWFKQVVKHQTRYVFLARDDGDHMSEVPPSEMLMAIGDTVNDELADLALIKELPVDTDFVRVRVGATPFETAAEIGTPPAERANQPNRMSPAGIAMFYCAFDGATALAETINTAGDAGHIATIGIFRPRRPLRVLDLADLPDIPSVFEEDEHPRVHPLRFLHAFAQDIAQPIARDGREHIEYVPTQIVTEYFRRVYRTSQGERIDGILYQSSRPEGARACVLFCEHEQCFESGGLRLNEQLVELVGLTHEQL
ncbi:MAG: HEPN-associated N-terminal domain-containing protein [Sphingomicrobium sp.]